ncbi:MAG: arylamine N-acetyltransferase, partial [Ignavibacteria bacterium]
ELINRETQDFNEMCHYKWTSPESKFTKEYVCSRTTGTGRIYLRSSVLFVFEKGKRYEKRIESEEEFRTYLEKYFGKEYLQHVRNYKLKT